MEPYFDGQPFGFRFGNSRLGDAPGAYGPPDPEEEGPEVWCPSCEWDHPVGSAHIYGKNSPTEETNDGDR